MKIFSKRGWRSPQSVTRWNEKFYIHTSPGIYNDDFSLAKTEMQNAL